MDLSWGELAPFDRLVNTQLIEPRSYQINIIRGIYSGKNTLVILPTGLGKTLIAVFAIAKSLQEGRKALMLAPTKPLGEQHYNSLVKLLNIEKEHILLLTGSLSGSKRSEMESNAKVIIATPQTFSNDLKRARVTLEDFGVVVFDECHRAVGRYAYTYISEESKLRGSQLLGLTASPGSDRRKINALVETLGIDNIEMRISTDMDVAPYVMQKDTRVITVEKGRTIESILENLKPVLDQHLSNLYSHGLSPFKYFENMPKGRLLQIGDAIKKIEARNYRFMAISNYVYVLNLAHAYDLAATEGLYPFVHYMESLSNREKKSRAVIGILANKQVISATDVAREAIARGEEHPKMSVLVELLNGELKNETIIIFAQYRSTTERLTSVLKENGIAAREFVGKRVGITQADQQQTIEAFRKNDFRVLVATSIGEEGLDIPSVDAVVFYEPIPNEIRNIQRKGRAGRIKFGRIIILVTKNTKDETYLLISRLKEKRMRDIIIKVKERMDRGMRPGPDTEMGQRFLAR